MKVEIVKTWDDKCACVFPTIMVDYEDYLIIGIVWLFWGISFSFDKEE